MKKYQFFFIVGRPRSGTTLLLTILDANPHILIPVEWPIISKLLPKYQGIRNFSPVILQEFYRDLEKTRFHEHYGFYDMRFDHEAIRKEILNAPANSRFCDLISIVYSHYKSLFPKTEIRALGDKNPLASRQINSLMKVFPDSKFIHITRDYRDHTVSMLNAGFGKGNIPLIVYRWRKFQHIIERANQHCPERFFIVKYENLVAEPDSTVSRICDFLGITYYPEMLDFHQTKLNELYPKMLSEKYQTSLQQAVTTGRTGIWKNKFNEKELKLMDYMAGNTADRWGYQRTFRGLSLTGIFYRLWFTIRGYLMYFRQQ